MRSKLLGGTVLLSAAAMLISGAFTPAAPTATGMASDDKAGPAQPDALVSAQQLAEYRAVAPKTIIELQPFRRTTTVSIQSASGRLGTASLINLNPAIDAWYLMTLRWERSDETQTYHLENPNPGGRGLSLQATARGLVLFDAGGGFQCEVWSSEAEPLELAKATGLPYAPLCENHLYLRNVVAGTYTHIERVTQFLRDHVWGGDKIVGFVRDVAYRDAYAETGAEKAATAKLAPSPEEPRSAQVRPEDTLMSVDPENLEIDLGMSSSDLMLGDWYPVSDAPGIYLSIMRPGAVPDAILSSYRGSVSSLDTVEASGLDYLVALDMSQFELHFALGTDHPRVGWSERVLDQERDPSLPGPDGIGSVAPLALNGMVSPALTARVAATFAGGFKREHGAFRYGSLALHNSGSHYGFMQEGVIFSKLQPGLATLYRSIDGSTKMKTWAAQDDAMLERIADARQNGVPLIDYDAASGSSAPGPLVNQWGPGNWSGSTGEQLRTVRAGVCLQDTSTRHFLIFGYFSTATPSAMARLFQAYGCRYAMQLDINALEHTYFALYTRRQAQVVVQHLIHGMGEVDRKGGDQLSPRFLGFPDDRDFFYLVRRAAQ
jgi:hypothetical protein